MTPHRPILKLVFVAAITTALICGATVSALSQSTGDASFTGAVVDSFGAKADITTGQGLPMDPIFAYVQTVALEQLPLATAHGYVAFPGTLLASTVITCCGASPDYPRFGGQIPSETVCGDPGNLKRSEPEVRDPRNYAPPAPIATIPPVGPLPGQTIQNPNQTPPAPYNTNCAPGSAGCDIRRRGNDVSSENRQEFAAVTQNRATFAGGYGLSVCEAAKGFAYSDQRVQNANLIPVGTAAASAGQPAAGGLAPPTPVIPETPAGGLLPPAGTTVLPSLAKVSPQQTTVYGVNMGSVTSFSKVELLGPGFLGAPNIEGIDVDSSLPLATTGAPTNWLTILGILILAGSIVIWGLSRRIGRVRAMALVATALIVGSQLGFAPPARSAEPLRVVGTVISKANDVVITSGALELIRIAEVTVVGVAEANGQPGGAKTAVTRTVRGVKILGQDQADLNADKINEQLASTGLSVKLGEVKRTAETDGSAASVEATGLILEQKIVQTLVGGASTPEFKLTLARATPSVSFFSLAALLGTGADFGGGFTEAFSGAEGELSGGGNFGAGADFATPRSTGIPGIKQVGPGKYLVQGKFAGFDFGDFKLSLWAWKDIAEAAGGMLLIIALALAVRHRRRFAAA